MATNDTRRLRVVVTGESAGAQEALEQVGEAADNTESKFVTLSKTIAGWAGRGAIALGAVGVAAATMGFSAASNLEQVSVGFTTMLGSAEKAQKFLKELQSFANTTPFEFEDVTGAAQKFLSMGFAAKDVIPMLTAVGDAVAAMGGGAEQIDSVTTALSQMQIKGKVSGEEIMQLSEQGIPALQILADGFKVSTSQMSDMISKGKVMSDKAIPMIIDGLEHGTKSVKGFGGMMEAQSQTMAGKWSTFMDTMKTGLGNLASKFLPMAKVAVDTASNSFQAFFSGLSGKESGASGFIGVLNQIGAGLKDFVGTVQGFEGKAKGGIAKTFSNMGVAIRSIITAYQDATIYSDGWTGKLEVFAVTARKAVDIIQVLIGAVISVIGWMREHENVMKGMLYTMTALVALTKLHATVTGVQAAGGLLSMLKNLSLVSSAMKIAAAVQWAYNGAMAAASYLQIAGYLGAVSVAQKAVAAGSRIAAAAQWAWNAAMAANPIGIVITVIAALVAAVVLLWKNNEGFRNWVLGTLWPSLKKAWDQIKGAFDAAVNGIIAAWNWLKDGAISIWNSVYSAVSTAVNAVVGAVTTAFNAVSSVVSTVWNAVYNVIRTAVNGIITFFSPLTNAIKAVGEVVLSFYTAIWKIVWIAIQVAVKIFVQFFKTQAVPVINAAFAVIQTGVAVLRGIWEVVWNAIRAATARVVQWVTGTLVPSLQKAWDQAKAGLNALRGFFVAIWNGIKNAVVAVANWIANVFITGLQRNWNTVKAALNALKGFWSTQWQAITDKVRSVFNAIIGPISNIFNSALNKLRSWLNGFRSWWNGLFDGMRNKSKSTMDGIVKAFNVGKDGIARAWQLIQNVAKAPVNFVINEVYNKRIRALWNKVADKFGVKTRLDEIKGFAKGGVVGNGYGTKDDQLSLLMRGEGVLTTKEMKRLGGPAGFNEFRASLAAYGNGGVVGGGDGPGSWFKQLASKGKDIFQGAAASVVRPLVNAVKSFVGNHLQGGGFAGMMRGGANTILDKFMSWVSGKDNEIMKGGAFGGSLGGSGSAMGWAAMRNLISGRFPALHMISGFRPGARTLSGNRSYHSLGRAVDYPPVRALAQWIRGTFGAKTKELITPFQELNLHNGRPHTYTGAIWNQHNFAGGNAHVHWAMDDASVVQPGWFTGYNGTGKPEKLLNADKYGSGVHIENLNITVGGAVSKDQAKKIAKDIRDELITLSRRNGGRTGLPQT